MSLNNMDSSSGALVANGYDGDAVSEAILQDVADGDFVGVRNTSAKYEYANISEATVADTLVTSSPIENGDNLVIVKDDNSVHEVVASGVVVITAKNGMYSMDTTSITAGEIPSRVFTVDSKVAFDDTSGFQYPIKNSDAYVLTSEAEAGPDLTPGLVAHYLLNNNSDDSYGSYDGTSTDVDFQGDSAEFNGTSSVIIAPLVATPLANETKTISFWFKGNGLGSYYSTLSTRELSTGWMIVARLNDIGYYHVGKGEQLYTPTLSVDTLYHAVIMTGANGADVKIYLDGVLLTPVSNTLLPALTETGDLEIGRQAEAYSGGLISNLRIYNGAKDQTFIDDLYAEGYYPKSLTEPTTNGLIAHYPLTGTAEDSTGTYDGTEVSMSYVNDAEFGSVADFNGTSSSINLPLTTLNGTQGAFSLWFKGSGFPISKSDTSTTNHVVYVNFVSATSLSFFIKTTSIRTTLTVSTTLTSSDLIHFVLVSTGSAYKMYINGVDTAFAVTEGSDDGKWFGDLVTANESNLGVIDWFGTDLYFDGSMSNVRIYDKALTTTEITDIYTYEKNFRPIDIDDGLIAYHPLANNSLDNYYNEHDGADSNMVYNGVNSVFNGANSSVTLTNVVPANLDNATISLWVKTSGIDAGQNGFIGDTSSSNASDRYWFGLREAIYYIDWGDIYTTGRISGVTDPSWLNTFVLVTVTRTPTSMSFYVNGNLIKEQLNSTTCSLTSLSIGKYGAAYFEGEVANLRIYTKPLTPEQIEAIYNTEKGDFIPEITAVASLTNTRQYDNITVSGRSIETKVELKSIGDKCTEVSADLWKIP